MSIRAHWFITLITAAALAINLGFIFDETTPRQTVIVINMILLFLLGVAGAKFLHNLADEYYSLKAVVEKLQTPGGYLEEDLDLLEAQP